VKKPSYQELVDKVRELKNESRERKRVEKKLLEKQSILEKQNIKLVQKSIELSDVMRELEDKNYDLELSQAELKKTMASLREKEILLKEVHHHVKNNMQIISSLLRLQSGNIENDEILEKFRIRQNRIRSLALIHERLCRPQILPGSTLLITVVI
jgi:two-component sensor histidine kinase